MSIIAGIAADQRGRGEPLGEAAAEEARLQRDQLDVDHGADDEEDQARGVGEPGQAGGDEGVGL
jgi:hypothetical protein